MHKTVDDEKMPSLASKGSTLVTSVSAKIILIIMKSWQPYIQSYIIHIYKSVRYYRNVCIDGFDYVAHTGLESAPV